MAQFLEDNVEGNSYELLASSSEILAYKLKPRSYNLFEIWYLIPGIWLPARTHITMKE